MSYWKSFVFVCALACCACGQESLFLGYEDSDKVAMPDDWPTRARRARSSLSQQRHDAGPRDSGLHDEVDAGPQCVCDDTPPDDDLGARCDCDVAALPKARAVSIDTRCSSTCALLDDGDVRCWGYNGTSELGDASENNRGTPVQVRELHGVRDLAVACKSACALVDDGTVRCWGSIVFGDGQPVHRAPVQIPGISAATQIAASDGHGCALLADGSVRCWGNTAAGSSVMARSGRASRVCSRAG